MIGQLISGQAQYERLALKYARRANFLFLGRGKNYPLAMEGALKLKEISYIHAEGYPAGEMKHGPISLIDRKMPVVALAPKDDLYEKMLEQHQRSQGAPGKCHRRRDRGRRAHLRKSRRCNLDTQGVGEHHPHSQRHSNAAAGIPHRRRARLRRRPAAQSRQVGDRRVGFQRD